MNPAPPPPPPKHNLVPAHVEGLGGKKRMWFGTLALAEAGLGFKGWFRV